MAKGLPGPLLGGLRGRVNDTIFRIVRGRQIVSAPGIPTGTPTRLQQLCRNNMSGANQVWDGLRSTNVVPGNTPGVLNEGFKRLATKQRLPPTAVFNSLWLELGKVPIRRTGTSALCGPTPIPSRYDEGPPYPQYVHDARTLIRAAGAITLTYSGGSTFVTVNPRSGSIDDPVIGPNNSFLMLKGTWNNNHRYWDFEADIAAAIYGGLEWDLNPSRQADHNQMQVAMISVSQEGFIGGGMWWSFTGRFDAGPTIDAPWIPDCPG